MWLELTPEIAGGFERIIHVKSKEEKQALSNELVYARRSKRSVDGDCNIADAKFGKREGERLYKPHATAFFGYLLAHEWYHHGEICMTLTQAGHRLQEEILYTIWSGMGFRDEFSIRFCFSMAYKNEKSKV